MKLVIALAMVFFLPIPAWAVQWEVVGQGSPEPAYRGSFSADLSRSVGQISVQIFTDQKIPFIGNEAGLNSLLNTPTGDALLVVVNDDTLRAYGWCYELDGVQPAEMPDKVYFPKQDSTLRWFFGYALYEKGEWRSYCNPAYELPLEMKSN